MSKTCVVILNWNGWKDTIECLKSIDNNEKKSKNLEIIVVDNASTDTSVKRIKKLSLKNFKVTLLKNEQNLGFAGGNNVGIDYALKNKFDYIFILNNDTEIGKNAISKLAKYMDENKIVGVASPKIYFAKGFEFHKKRYSAKERGGVIWYAGGDMDWDNVLGTNHGVDEVDTGQFNETADTVFATGAAMILRSEVVKKFGKFDERFFLYFEDTDLSLRFKRAGYQIKYFPNSVIWHKVSRSSGIGSDLNDYYITRNRLLLAINWAPWRAKFAVIKESIFFIARFGREWQVKGAMDFYLRKFGKGTWK